MRAATHHGNGRGQAMNDRERIARIIDLVSFDVQGSWMELPSHHERRLVALGKADAILSLPSLAQGEDAAPSERKILDALRAKAEELWQNNHGWLVPGIGFSLILAEGREPLFTWSELDALRSAPSGAVPEGWRPIETRPRDNSAAGKRFLFGRVEDERFAWVVSGFFQADGTPWHEGGSAHAFPRMPTHFREFDWSLPPHQRGRDMKLTKAQRRALKMFAEGDFAPRYQGIRRATWNPLFSAGYIVGAYAPGVTNDGYAIMGITPAGRAALHPAKGE